MEKNINVEVYVIIINKNYLLFFWKYIIKGFSGLGLRERKLLTQGDSIMNAYIIYI